MRIAGPSTAELGQLLDGLPDGRAKLYLISRLLRLRKEREALFRHGGYTAVRTSGTRARHVVAYARRHAGDAIVTIAPRLIAGLGVPLLFVVGEHDLITSPAMIREAQGLIPGARYHEIAGAGHSAYFEAAVEWDAAVAAFLADMDS